MLRTRRHTLFLVLVITATILVACGGTQAPQSSALTAPPATTAIPAPNAAPVPTTAPTIASAPTAAPVATTAAAATTAPAATSEPLADTSPAKPDDATQGRLRMVNCVFGGSDVDVFMNGNMAVNSGMPQANLHALDVSGYVYLAPATYSVALVPTGKGIDQALLGPLDVSILVGHRYTIAILGQADEKNHTPLVIDETEAYQKAGVSASTAGHISINNVKGATGVSFIQDGAGEKDVPYGGFAASTIPAGLFKDFKVTISGAGQPDVENNGAGFNIPGFDWLDCFGGIYPTSHDTHSAFETSTSNTIDFLQIRSDGFAKIGHPEWGYTSFLAALKTSGLADMLTTGGPYLVFAPTDEAFTALPKEKLDALMADPKALADLVRSHVVEGYYPYGSLSAAPGLPGPDRTVTNLRGDPLKLLYTTINGQDIGEAGGTMIANGTRINPVNKLLLLPATSSANPLVGKWQRVNSCESFMQAFKEAELTDLAAEWLVGAGYYTSLDQIDTSDLCKGATEVQHSHSFSDSGGFGSYDEKGARVDDGRFTIVDDHMMSFNNGITVQYSIEGDTAMFAVVVPDPCTGNCRGNAAWALSAFYPGPFQRVP